MQEVCRQERPDLVMRLENEILTIGGPSPAALVGRNVPARQQTLLIASRRRDFPELVLAYGLRSYPAATARRQETTRSN